ncbi:putative trichodiene synthase [Xylogone sp. PMI_703]|nr:putative trichodiene synthase [Xylogone sp. PMI_703]
MPSQHPQANDPNMETEKFKQQYKGVLQHFLQDISFQVLPCTYDPSMENAVIQYLKCQHFSVDYVLSIMPTIRASAWIAAGTYPFVPKNVQEIIAIYTTLMITVDDISKDNVDDYKDFQVRLLRKQSQPNPALRSIVQFMDVIRQTYGNFVSNMIMKETIGFVDACIFEQEYEGKLVLTQSTPEFPLYLRLKTGIAEVYSLFAFPQVLYPEEKFLSVYIPAVPDILKFFNFTNDLLSFYKESVISNDRLNYISNYSRVKNITPLQSLETISAELVTCIRNIRTTLADYPEMQGHMEQLFHGYIMFHMSASRYRLSELEMKEVDEVMKVVHFPSHDKKGDAVQVSSLYRRNFFEALTTIWQKSYFGIFK